MQICWGAQCLFYTDLLLSDAADHQSCIPAAQINKPLKF